MSLWNLAAVEITEKSLSLLSAAGIEISAIIRGSTYFNGHGARVL